jgi:cysteine-rich repeat protein
VRLALRLILGLGCTIILSGCGGVDTAEQALVERLEPRPVHDASAPRVGGFVIVSGDDADDGGHCEGTRCGSLYQTLFREGIVRSRSGGKGILAIGVNWGDALYAFNTWNDPALGGPGAPVTFLKNPEDIASVEFSSYAMIYLPSANEQTLGGINVTQLTALKERQPDIAHFVNVQGGSLIALTQAEVAGGWGFLPVPLVTQDMEFDHAKPTPELLALSPNTTEANLTHHAFHNVFTGPSGYSGLQVLAVNSEVGSPGYGLPVMLGGNGVILTAEVCDDGRDNDGDGQTDHADSDCQVCGNGHLDPGEACDDGNLIDGDGCSASCQTELNPAPVAVCEEALSVCTDAGRCVATVTGLGAGSYDPEGEAVTREQTPAGPYSVGSRQVEVRVSDGHSEASCHVALEVKDCEPPQLTCPAPFRVECGGEGQGSVTPPPATATDNCANPTVHAPVPASHTLGETTLVYSATDAAGNTGTCSTTVTVEDTAPPSITCPGPTVAECSGERGATVQPGAATASDVCALAGVTQAPSQHFPLGTTEVSFTATDLAGHTATCTSSVTVRDTTPPVLHCPDNVVAECTGDHQATVNPGTASAEELCTSATVQGPSAGSFPVGTTSVTFSASDEAGNSAVCTRTVTVRDSTPPSISCPEPVVAECTDNRQAPVDPGTAQASDVCGGASVSDLGLASYPLGTTPVTFTATDDAGLQATCTSAVTVRDTTAPSISCPAPTVAECTGDRGAQVTPGAAQAADRCTSATVEGPGGGFFPLGTTQVAYSARDESGNAATCTSAVTVRDTTAPSLTCPAPVVAECSGNGQAVVDPGVAQAVEACTSATVNGPGSGSYPLGTSQVTFTAQDESGNAAVCTSSVTVRDTLPPSITCPAPIIAQCTGNGGATVTPGVATATDACTAPTVTGPAAGHYPVGTTVVTYSATDGGGQQASCSSTIQVVDSAPPVVTVTNPNPLWPPNHKYRTVSLADCGVLVQDACGGTIDLATARASITCVTSDEPPNSTGDGNTTGDIVIVNATTVTLRGERRGNSDGRVYEIHFQVSDASGNTATGVCPVAVPHDQSGRAAVDSGDAYKVCRR